MRLIPNWKLSAGDVVIKGEVLHFSSRLLLGNATYGLGNAFCAITCDSSCVIYWSKGWELYGDWKVKVNIGALISRPR
jgi:hypothetical protein